MDKTMKTIITTIFLSLSFVGFSQTWKTLDGVDYGLIFYPTHRFLFGTSHRQGFKINHTDSSIWMCQGRSIMQFDGNGDFHEYNADHVDFDLLADFKNITFIDNKVYACNRYYGLYEFDAGSWTKISTVQDGVYLASDLDTLWMGQQLSGGDLIVADGAQSFGISSNRRLASKNGEFWGGSPGFYIKRYQVGNGSYDYISADTIPYLLDNSHNYFCFSPNDNRFYTAGDLGISVALNKVFIDTITPFNTIGMPMLPVVEIEFDSQDNIWAMFGTDIASSSVVSFGYLNRTTNEWTIYDTSNTGIADFRGIEVDPCDNLWVSEDTRLHVLDVGGCDLGWLGSSELTIKSTVEIYPNPASDQVVITSEQLITKIVLYDASGRELQQLVLSAFQTEVNVSNVSSGTYIVKIFTDVGLATKKIVKL
jgi:hypothetical protein